MGETGLLLDRDGVAVAPGFAWFDPRGQQQIDAMPERLRSQFAGRTGLPVGAQVSVAKLLHLRENGLELEGSGGSTSRVRGRVAGSPMR